MHKRKQHLQADVTSATTSTSTSVLLHVSAGASRRKERRRRRLEIPAFSLVVFGILSLGILITATLYTTQTPGGERDNTVHLSEASAAFNTTKEPPPDASATHTTKNSSSKDEDHKKDPYYHILFSTSCSDKMHWESYVLFYHAYKVKQPGNVTRLLSGCSEDQAKEQMSFHKQHIQTLSPYFHVHMTPDFSQIQHHEDDDKKERYKYLNKPLSLRHWLENILGYTSDQDNNSNKYDDDILFLIDPDIILLQPLTHDFSTKQYEKVLWVESEMELSLLSDSKIVRHGHPFSQQDGSLASDWLELNLTAVTLDPASPSLQITKPDTSIHWNSGPPYILTVHDAYRVVQLWTAYTPRVHKQYPFTFAEMYGYIIATAHLQLPHTFVKSLVVSTTATPNREGWPLIDAMPEGSVCPFPTLAASGLFALHYNKRYLLGNRTFWNKYRIPPTILHCAAPLLEEPHPSIQHLRQSMYPPPTIRNQIKANWTGEPPSTVSPKIAKREAFMLCGLISKTNEALEYYKRRACSPNDGNFSKVYSTHTDPGY